MEAKIIFYRILYIQDNPHLPVLPVLEVQQLQFLQQSGRVQGGHLSGQVTVTGSHQRCHPEIYIMIT